MNFNEKMLCLKNAFFIDAESQPAITCSKLTIETLEQGVKYVQSIVNFEQVNAGWNIFYFHWLAVGNIKGSCKTISETCGGVFRKKLKIHDGSIFAKFHHRCLADS